MMLKPEEFEKYYNILKKIADIRLMLSKIYVCGSTIEPCDFISLSNILKKNNIEANIDFLKYQSEPMIPWYSFLFFLNSRNIGIGRNELLIITEFNRLPVNINLKHGDKIKSMVDWILSTYQNRFSYILEKKNNNILSLNIINRNSPLRKYSIQQIGEFKIKFNEGMPPEWNLNESIGIRIELPEIKHYYEVIGISITEADALISKNYYVLKRA